jgi:hypothetical protein
MAGTSRSFPIFLCPDDDEKAGTIRRAGTAVADRRGFRRILCALQGEAEAHAFAWSPDGSQIFFSCASPLSKSAEEANKAQWKDVIRWREQERGDLLLAMPVASAIAAAQKNPPAHPAAIADDALPLPALARTIATSPDEIKEIAPDPKGAQIAFMTDSVSHRLEDPKHNEIYLVSSSGGEARRLTNNQARESACSGAADGSKLFFHVGGR